MHLHHKLWPGALAGMALVATIGSVAGATAPVGDDGTGYLVDFLGSTTEAVDESLDPFTIGWANQEGGTLNFAAGTAAAQVAVDFVNEHGGVQGRQVVLEPCALTAPEDLQRCAIEFANDSDIDVVMVGTSLMDNAPFYAGVGDVAPLFIAGPLGPADFTAAGAVAYSVGTPAQWKAFAKVAEGELELDDRILVVHSDSAVSIANNDALRRELEAIGFTNVQSAALPDTASATDATSILQASEAGEAVAIMPLTVASTCITLDVGLDSIGASPELLVTTAGCASQAVIDHFGGTIPDSWRFVGSFASPHVPQVDNGVAGFLSVLAERAPDLDPAASGPQRSFAAIVNVVAVANGVDGELSADTLSAALHDFTGPAYMNPGEQRCGFLPDTPVLCATEVPVLSYSDGAWVETTISLV